MAVNKKKAIITSFGVAIGAVATIFPAVFTFLVGNKQAYLRGNDFRIVYVMASQDVILAVLGCAAALLAYAYSDLVRAFLLMLWRVSASAIAAAVSENSFWSGIRHLAVPASLVGAIWIFANAGISLVNAKLDYWLDAAQTDYYFRKLVEAREHMETYDYAGASAVYQSLPSGRNYNETQNRKLLIARLHQIYSLAADTADRIERRYGFNIDALDERLIAAAAEPLSAPNVESLLEYARQLKRARFQLQQWDVFCKVRSGAAPQGDLLIESEARSSGAHSKAYVSLMCELIDHSILSEASLRKLWHADELRDVIEFNKISTPGRPYCAIVRDSRGVYRIAPGQERWPMLDNDGEKLDEYASSLYDCDASSEDLSDDPLESAGRRFHRFSDRSELYQ